MSEIVWPIDEQVAHIWSLEWAIAPDNSDSPFRKIDHLRTDRIIRWWYGVAVTYGAYFADGRLLAAPWSRIG